LKMLRDFPDGLGQARTVDDGKLVLSVWSQPTFAVKEIILRQVGRMRSRSSLDVAAVRLSVGTRTTAVNSNHADVFVPAYTLSSAGMSSSPKVDLTTYAKAPALPAARM
jgi:hypothetical protein